MGRNLSAKHGLRLLFFFFIHEILCAQSLTQKPVPQVLLNASFLGFRIKSCLVLVNKVRDGILVLLPCVSLHI